MKKITLFIVYGIIAGVLFSSCGTNLSLVKRHYTKGYYVEHSSVKQKRSLFNGKEIDFKNEIAAQLHSAYKQPAATNDFKDIEQGESTESPASISGNHPNKKVDRIFRKTTPKKQIAARILPDKIYHKLAPDSDADRALSFFWIVILVILIVWLIGFLAGGFGLGNFIHLLLVVALILLILWLLRII